MARVIGNFDTKRQAKGFKEFLESIVYKGWTPRLILDEGFDGGWSVEHLRDRGSGVNKLDLKVLRIIAKAYSAGLLDGLSRTI